VDHNRGRGHLVRDGGFLWLFLYSSSDNAPYPSIADVFYLGFYPASTSAWSCCSAPVCGR
jgi:hypothetical protein